MFYFVQNQSSPRRSKSIKHKNGESIRCLYLTGVNVCTASGLSSPTDSEYWHLQVKAHHTVALGGKPFRFTGNYLMLMCCWVPIIFCKSNVDDSFFWFCQWEQDQQVCFSLQVSLGAAWVQSPTRWRTLFLFLLSQIHSIWCDTVYSVIMVPALFGFSTTITLASVMKR